jgi:hypothetical protein
MPLLPAAAMAPITTSILKERTRAQSTVEAR